MRKSDLYLIFMLFLVTLLLGVLVIYPPLTAYEHQAILEEKKRFVKDLELTDLCLFTDARYARHLSQADLHSAFQDHPLAMDHFPSGSLVLPPKHLLSDERQN
ncbi:MAG: hypothetical protein C4576_16845 [Desulfobacteraceae bacterium]|nr:MAG: hypothetical protein C4576_16845 [Desulfobacteraceae bacterium]